MYTAMTGAAFFFGAKNMKRIAIILILLITGCGPKIVGPQQDLGLKIVRPQQDLGGVMRLIGLTSFAHACPVDGLVLSAGHVVQPRNGLNPAPNWPAYYAWSDQNQNSGYVQSMDLLPRDLGVFTVLSGNPYFYRHATESPGIGDTLHWLEYDQEKAFEPRARQALVLRSVAGHLILDALPMSGASGACVLNDQNEVVALIIGRKKTVGVAVSLYGQWWPGGMVDGG